MRKKVLIRSFSSFHHQHSQSHRVIDHPKLEGLLFWKSEWSAKLYHLTDLLLSQIIKNVLNRSLQHVTSGILSFAFATSLTLIFLFNSQGIRVNSAQERFIIQKTLGKSLLPVNAKKKMLYFCFKFTSVFFFSVFALLLKLIHFFTCCKSIMSCI